MEGFSRVIEYNFQLWTHLQNALEISTIEDHIYESEA
jgi:hypothetical protein